jgi:hypothetical protein
MLEELKEMVINSSRHLSSHFPTNINEKIDLVDELITFAIIDKVLIYIHTPNKNLLIHQ